MDAVQLLSTAFIEEAYPKSDVITIRIVKKIRKITNIVTLLY